MNRNLNIYIDRARLWPWCEAEYNYWTTISETAVSSLLVVTLVVAEPSVFQTSLVELRHMNSS